MPPPPDPSPDPTHPVGRRPTLLGGLLLSAATLLALWLLAEATLRIFFDGVSPPIRIATRDIGETNNPSYRGLLYDEETGRAVPMRFNALGFRGPDRPEQKPAGVRRVAVLGDSMVAGLAVAEPETMCAVAESLLNGAGGDAPRVEVMNFGVPASSPAGALALYRGVVRRLAPDVVVLAFYSGNDLSDTLHEISDRYPRIYFDLDTTGALRPRPYDEATAVGRALARSRVFAWAGFLVRKASRHVRTMRNPFSPSAHGYLPDGDPRAEKAWRLLEAIVAAFAKEVRADGAEPVVLAIPGSIQIYPVDADALRAWAGPIANVLDLDVQERRLARLCERIGLPLVALEPALLAAADTAEDPVYFKRLGHLSPRGHRVAAEHLAAELRRLRLVDASSAVR